MSLCVLLKLQERYSNLKMQPPDKDEISHVLSLQARTQLAFSKLSCLLMGAAGMNLASPLALPFLKPVIKFERGYF